MTSAADGRLEGKVCLVTGAARGIGKATATQLAHEGALVVLADIDGAALGETVAELRGSGHERLAAVVGDVSSATDAQAMVTAALETFGRLDVLVANAGVIELSDILTATPEDWDHVMAVDGRGMFLTCKYAITAMLDGGGGSIVCLSSISGVAGQSGQAVYGPAKFVASGLTQHLAVEWAARGIRVNAVAPGTIRTDAVVALLTTPQGVDYIEQIERLHPMGRLGEPAEVAAAICFLASDQASFITGAILPVDGGYLAQ